MINTIKPLFPKSWSKYCYTVRSILTEFFDQVRIFLSRIKRIFLPVPFPTLEKGVTHLHLGCGEINHPKFINIDGRPASHVHFVRSIDNLSPFKSRSVDLIYASHCLEHFSHTQVSGVLTEWFRVLKSDGILRLSVPDFDCLIEIYKTCGNDIGIIMNPLMGGQDYKYNFHRVVFTKASLTRLLENVGFKDIREWQPNECELTSFDDHSTCEFETSGRTYSISINLQARKE